MTREAPGQSKIILRAFKIGFALWRNNSGAMELLENNGEKRFVRFGMGNDSAKINKVWKSPDLVGIGPYGRFVGCEVKPEKWVYGNTERERAQSNCLNDINRLGGIGFFCRSADEYEEIMKRYM